MCAKNLASRAISGICMLALALLLASCKKGSPIEHNRHTVGGNIAGLTSTGLVLQNNGRDDLARSTDGRFTFSTALANGSTYNVTVLTYPAGQSCAVANATGIVRDDVRDVEVSCVNETFTVAVTVSGLSGPGLVLQNNSADDLSVDADGTYTFATALANGSGYAVTVLSQPSGQACAVANGNGSVNGANVTNVAVDCMGAPAAPTLSLDFGVKELRFSWAAVAGAAFYRLLENPDGVSGYSQAEADVTALSINHTIPVHLRLNASYIVQACNAAGCTDSAPQTILGSDLTRAIGYIKASNTAAGDQFGFALAVSGDGNTLAIGARNQALNAGAVYVFARSVGGWLQQDIVTAVNAEAGDRFGTSVALSHDGNTLAVGAANEGGGSTDVGGTEVALGAGAVYVYVRNGGTWSHQAYVKASNIGAGDLFGNSVALSSDGNMLAVGAPAEDSSIVNPPNESAPNAGAAYVYARNGGTWSAQAYVKGSNTGAGDFFGISVALSGDGTTLAVGANGEDGSNSGIGSTPNENFSSAGAVYVFLSVAGTWSEQAYVKSSSPGVGDQFGVAVALSGDGNTLAVGAPAEDSSTTGIGSTPDETFSNAGAAYVYARSGSAWSEQAYVKASNTRAGDQFGSAVALSGDGNALAVGAPLGDLDGTGIDSTANQLVADSGAAYFFTRSADVWSQRAYIKASNTGSGDRFGASAALSSDGNTLAVGAPFEDSDSIGINSAPNDPQSNFDAGAVFLY